MSTTRQASRWMLRGFHLRVVLAVTVVTSVLVLLASWAMWLLERSARGSTIHSFPDAVWWAMETITTVGYGDHHPTTTGGRFVASALMVSGVALVGVITATVVTWFFAELDVVREMREIEEEGAREEATLDEVLRRLGAIEESLARIRERDESR